MEHNRELSRWRPSAGIISALFVTVLWVLFYAHFVLAFGVNVPFWDDWELLDQIRQIHSGQLHWWRLALSAHNEHLMGTAFLLESLQLFLTNFNYKLQLLTGVFLQALSFTLLLALLWDSIPAGRRPIWVVISSTIWFSLAQHKDLLWAFQTAWFLISFFLTLALICLELAERAEQDPRRRGDVWLAAAVAMAVLATFASLQGIIVWFAGLVYLLGSRSYSLVQAGRNSMFRRWLISGFVTGIAFAYVWIKMGGRAAENGGRFSLAACAQIFFGIQGAFWGDLGIHQVVLLGIVTLCFVCLALIRVARSQNKAEYSVPVALIAFGLCFGFLVAVGRAKFGVGPATDSHYTAYSVFTYFGILSILMRTSHGVPRVNSTLWIPFAFCTAILLAAFSSSYDAVLHGIDWRSDQGMAVAMLIRYKEQPDFVLARTLFGDPAMVRRNAEFLEANKLGPFRDPGVIPESVINYVTMPKSMEAALARFPEHQNAIRRAWQVYQIGSDLRKAFNPISDEFPRNLLAWCAAATESTGSHYLSPYLMPFAADYAQMKKEELADTDPLQHVRPSP